MRLRGVLQWWKSMEEETKRKDGTGIWDDPHRHAIRAYSLQLGPASPDSASSWGPNFWHLCVPESRKQGMAASPLL